MGWERYGRYQYYYHKRRVGKRVVSEYLGRGDAVELLIEFELANREAQRFVQNQEQEMRHRAKETESTLRQLEAAARALTTATLLASGFHTHKGQWRRNRNETNGTS